ncbi:hypothetical protein ASG84_00435 [Rhodococcus sp. Leaf278]|uniref:hypothetical protein n=1 Tax=Rhodococcus sp. Leaf278 TaxID=1736319 RepID=UPI00070C74AC|nr:hypothetical protein [Rhodococcus sp. Leaf278]KQU61051.1 hypothetical protein ASG84_00435 [Rhodococcus sp. Leaf278]
MSAFVTASRFIGDLDDEFYADELQRDIWNEASAVGFQSLLWIGLISGAVLPFAAGVTGAWIALGLFLVLMSVSLVVSGYARVRGVDMYAAQKLRRSRIAFAGLLFFLAGAGAALRLLAHYGGGNLQFLWIGAAIGAPVGLAAGVVGIKNRRRQVRETELAADRAELLGFDPSK